MNTYYRPRLAIISLLASAALALPGGARAQASDRDLGKLFDQIDQLRIQQQQTEAKIAELQAALLRARATQAHAAPEAAPQPLPIRTTGPAQSAGDRSPGLQISGDLRLRYEANSGEAGVRNRDRGVLRARLGARYQVERHLLIGARIVTGDSDDPNSADVTLSSFADDLAVSLDQVFARGTFGNLVLTGGKMPQPFQRTDLVWDGDVNPQGLSASYTVPLQGHARITATALYFLIDEASGGPDSRMIGGQIGLEARLSPNWKATLAAAYYDYSLRSLIGADAGDIRSNASAEGAYLSDFNLMDIIAQVSWSGLGARWPIVLTGDYVRNFGSADEDDGFEADLAIGKASETGDLRIGYGYAETDTDAVLAAFSHDNTAIATNYQQHSLGLDYVLTDNVTLGAVHYRYRPKHREVTSLGNPGNWRKRTRLNLVVSF